MDHQRPTVTKTAGPATVLTLRLQIICVPFTCCNRFWINKNKSRTNKFPSSVLFISAASSSPRLREHFSPQVRVPGPAPCPGMLSRLPRVIQSQTIYRAEALEPLSSDGLVCSPGATPLGRGTGSEGVVVGPSEQRGVLFGGPPCLERKLPIRRLGLASLAHPLVSE